MIRFHINFLDCTWTRWTNRDNPGKTGDHESVSEYRNRDGINICNGKDRISIEARVSQTKADYSTTGESVLINPIDGFICLNANQPDNRCEDYEVRFFCCPLS